MNYYIASFTQLDGGHEHLDRVLVSAKNEEEARTLCVGQLYDTGEEPEDSLFGYFDGETAVKNYHLHEISLDVFQELDLHCSFSVLEDVKVEA